jgi:hypothetical protein
MPKDGMVWRTRLVLFSNASLRVRLCCYSPGLSFSVDDDIT